MMDVLFLAKNRCAFTEASFRTLTLNTDWSLVDKLIVYDDGSTDDTFEWLTTYCAASRLLPKNINVVRSNLGAPAAIMNDYLSRSTSALFAKIDNDVIVPPDWLNACLDVMSEYDDIDLLGIEPPESRTPHYAGGARSKCPEVGITVRGGALCDSIGGIGLMRRSAFESATLMRPHSTYGGFTEWQLDNKGVVKCWITPPLKAFLLDRLPTEPWASLSREYISKGWQRAWSSYDPAVPFWDWWTYNPDGIHQKEFI